MSTPPPLTERVLERLGRPRWLWMALWAALAFLVHEVTVLFVDLPMYPGLAFSFMSAYANLVTLIGAWILWRTIDEIRPAIEELTGDALFRPFDLAGWAAGPLLIGTLTSVVWTVPDFARHPAWATAWIVAGEYVAWLPGNTALWMYAMTVAGLYELGRRPLYLRPFEDDRSLGLRPIGILASRAILILTAAIIPLAAAGIRDTRTFVALLIIYLVGTLLMFVALRRIHIQMRAAKGRSVGQTRALVAEALRPITTDWSSEALEAQAQVLAAAERVERRTAAIQEWPIDDAILTRIAAILTAVGATIVARLILSSFGL